MGLVLGQVCGSHSALGAIHPSGKLVAPLSSLLVHGYPVCRGSSHAEAAREVISRLGDVPEISDSLGQMLQPVLHIRALQTRLHCKRLMLH